VTAPQQAAEPVVFLGMTGVQAALAAFGAGQLARPWRASCTICNGFHVAAADEGQARHLILTHADEEHTVADVWKAGEL